MLYQALADLVVLAHLGFVVFVIVGGFGVRRWPRLAWLHVPAALWGAANELAGWSCPLTPLENWLREAAGGTPYPGGFVEHYLLPVLYPGQLTRTLQIVLGIGVVVINAIAYGLALERRKRARLAS